MVSWTYSATVEFAVLGPLEVSSGGAKVEIPGAKERALLAHLVASCGTMVPASDLMFTLWGEEPPRSAAKSLQTFVLRLRDVLEPERGTSPQVLVTSGPGYRLDIDPMAVDAERFARLARLGRESLAQDRPDTAVPTLEDALRLWRGPAYAGFQDTMFGEAESRRLDELRMGATEDLWSAELERGHAVAAIPELERLVGAHPLRERLWELLILAVYREGQQGAALMAFDRARKVLADELGVDPGPALRELHRRVLAQDPSLMPRAPLALPAGLTRHHHPLVGRGEELDRLHEAWAKARKGEAVSLLLRGRDGSGRHHLVSALASDVVRSGAPVTLLDSDSAATPVDVPARGLLVVDGPECVPERPGSLLVVIADEKAEPRNGFEVMDLGPLGDEALRELVRGYVSDSELAAATDRVAIESNGWPGRAHQVAMRVSREAAAERAGRASAEADRSRSLLTEAREELAEAVTVLRGIDGPTAPVGTCPWRGLESYDVADAAWFAGRERLVAELTARLAGPGLVAVVGASGSGKSSLVRAGLLASLECDVIPGSTAWKRLVMRPGRHPMSELTRVALDSSQMEVGEHLSRLVLAPEDAATDRVVLVVDQMEELWTTCTDDGERAAFLDLLADAVRETSRLSVVLVLRADFVGAVADHPELARSMADSTVLVGYPSPDDIRRSIEVPAGRAGLVLDVGLADAIVGDAGQEPGILPLLSTALTQLWEQRDGDRLTFASYVGIGGLQGAIAHLAESAFVDLDAEEQAAVRLLFIRLTGPGAGGEVTRRRVTAKELGELDRSVVPRIVDVLSDARLLTVSESGVEVAHEALFREWPRLRVWLAEDAAGREVLHRLALAAAEWEDEHREPSLLWRGTRLDAAMEVADRRPDELTSLERTYLEAGQDASNSERRAIEQRAAATSRQNRRLRWLLVGLVAVVVAALIAGVVAVQARDRAERSEVSAEARRLAADALNEDYPDLALLSALEAILLEPNPDTYGALLTLISRDSGVVTRIRTPNRFLRIAVAPDGQTVYLLENAGNVSAYDALTGEPRWQVSGPSLGPMAVAASPDGASVLVLGDPGSGQVRLLDARTGDTIWDLGPGELQSAQDGGSTLLGDGAGFLPDGNAVFATSTHVVIASTAGQPRLRAVQWPRELPFAARLLVWPHGQVSVVTGAEDGDPTSELFDPDRPASGFRRLPGVVFAVSPDQRRLVVSEEGEGGGTLRIHSSTGAPRSPRSAYDGLIDTASYSPDGTQIVIAYEDRVEVRDARTLAVRRTFTAHNGAVLGAVFAGPDHDLVWTAGRDGTASALDLTGARGLMRTTRVDVSAHTGQGATGTDLAIINTFYDDRANPAHVVDAATGRSLFGELDVPPASCACQIEGTAITPDGSLAVGAVREFDENFNESGGLVAWQTTDGAVRQRVSLPWTAYAVGITPDAAHAVVNGTGGVAVVDLDSGDIVGEPISELPWDGSQGLPTVAVAPDGSRAMVARQNLLLEVDPDSGEVTRRYELPDQDWVTSLVWSADGQTLVVGGANGYIQFLDAASFAPVAPTRLIAAGFVAGLAASADGRLLASLGTDGDLMLWDAATWRPYGKPLADNHGWGVLTFSPDSDRLRVLYEDHTLLDMSVREADWVAAACHLANRDLTPEESAVIRPGAALRSTCGEFG
jgi:DNA-binding SARP family transcriptional activator/WD40 repeat protein